MRITMEKALAATAVGALDLVGEKYLSDKKFGPVSGADALRLGIATGSFLVNYLGYETEFSEAAFYASLPGVVRAVANMVKGGEAKGERVVIVERTTTVSAPAKKPEVVTEIMPP